jgi:hypothetical protein
MLPRGATPLLPRSAAAPGSSVSLHRNLVHISKAVDLFGSTSSAGGLPLGPAADSERAVVLAACDV